MPFLLLVGAAPNAIAYESKQFSSGEFFMAGVPASVILMLVLAVFVIAAVATPPDVITQISLAVPLYILYESSILFCHFWNKRVAKAEKNKSNGREL